MSVDPGLSHRLFFAARVSDGMRGCIATLVRGLDEPIRLVRPDHLHLTLAITDDFAESSKMPVEQLVGAGWTIDAEPFTIALDRIVASPNSIALRPAARAPELRSLQRQIAQAMRAAGAGLRTGWRFSPHVTLGYRAGAPSTGAIPPLVWLVDELVLVHSWVGRTRHDLLGRWPLRSRQSRLFGTALDRGPVRPPPSALHGVAPTARRHAMGLLDGLLGQVASNVDIDNLAAKIGLSPDQVEQGIHALGLAHPAPGDTVQTAADQTGLPADKLREMVEHIGGEGALGRFASLLGEQGGGGLGGALGGLASGLFGKS